MNKKLRLLPSYFLAVTVICGILAFSTTAVSAQANASAAPPDPISTVDLPQSEWKSAPEYGAVIISERASTALQLATPAIKVHNFALYSGYDRLLAYMQADLATNTPIEEIAGKNFKRVQQETPTDAVLKDMYPDAFVDMFNALLLLLHN